MITLTQNIYILQKKYEQKKRVDSKYKIKQKSPFTGTMEV